MRRLIEDIDYQSKYTYEQRADLFNKYQIPTNTKFLVPIWELAQFIVTLGNYNKKTFSGYGHGQNILNKDLKKNIEDNKELRIELSQNYITIRAIDNNAKKVGRYGRFRNMVIFNLENSTVKIARRVLFLGSYEIPRDLYQKIDEWLIDFGYNKWE